MGRNQTGRMCRVYWVSGQSGWSIGNDGKGSADQICTPRRGKQKTGDIEIE